MYTLIGLQETVARKGPWAARIHKPASRLCVRLIVNRWDSLTNGNAAEKKWAKNRIVDDVAKTYPAATWVIQILVSVIIKWLVSRRFLGVDQAIDRVHSEVD